MKINEYIFYCRNCEGTVVIPHEDIEITLDLYKDIYIFKSFCPNCGDSLKHERSAFPL